MKLQRGAATKIPDEISCPSCSKVCERGVITPCCRKNICENCVQDSSGEGDTFSCPYCRKQGISPSLLIPNDEVGFLFLFFSPATLLEPQKIFNIIIIILSPFAVEAQHRGIQAQPGKGRVHAPTVCSGIVSGTQHAC